MGIEVLVICAIWYAGVSGFPTGRMDIDDKSVVPINSVTNTKPEQLVRRSDKATDFFQLVKQQSDQEDPSNEYSPISRINKVLTSFSSFSSSIMSFDGNSTHEKQALTKTHSTSISDGITHFMKAESIDQTKENKNINGRTENTESIAEAKTIGVTNTNPDGSVKTVGTVVSKAAASQTAEGETNHQDIKAHVMAETVKNANGEERSNVKGAALSEKTKTNNGQSETIKTLAVGESEQMTHADGETERFEKFVVLHPDTTIDNSNNDNPKLKSYDTGKDYKNTESNNKGTNNIAYDNIIKYNKQNDEIRKVSGSKEEPSSIGMRDNIDMKHKANETDDGENTDSVIADDKDESVDDADSTGKTDDATNDKVEKDNDKDGRTKVKDASDSEDSTNESGVSGNDDVTTIDNHNKGLAYTDDADFTNTNKKNNK